MIGTHHPLRHPGRRTSPDVRGAGTQGPLASALKRLGPGSYLRFARDDARKILLAGAMLVAAAGPVAASPAFDAFNKVCGDTHGDFNAVKTAVSGAGWAPTEVHPATMEGVTVSESLARAATVANGVRVTLFAWQGTKGAVHISACTMRVTKETYADLSKAAQAWTGFAPQTADAGKTVWRFADDTRKAVAPADYNAAAAGGGLDFFTVSADRAETILDLLHIKS